MSGESGSTEESRKQENIMTENLEKEQEEIKTNTEAGQENIANNKEVYNTAKNAPFFLFLSFLY